MESGHLERIRETFADLFIASGSPAGAAMFSAAGADEGERIYFNPPASDLGAALLKENGALRCQPPLGDGDLTLLVGHRGDERLLIS